MISCGKLKNGLWKMVIKSQVVTKFVVTKSRLHCIFYNSFFSSHFVPAASNFKPTWQRQAAWIIEIKEIYSLSHIKIYSLHSLMTLFHDLASGLWRNALVYTNQAFFIFFSTFLSLKCKKLLTILLQSYHNFDWLLRNICLWSTVLLLEKYLL